LVRGSRDAGGDDARFSRQAGALGHGLKASDGILGLLVGFGALGFDEFRRNAAHHRAGDDRLIGKSNARDMGSQSLAERDGIIAGGILRAQSEIDDDILDHIGSLPSGIIYKISILLPA